MLTSEILTAARALIDTPEKWCNTSPTGRLGEKQCAGRAIETVAALQGPLPAVNAFIRAIGTQNIGKWNDAPERTHAEVMAAFDKATAAERAREAAGG